MHEANYTVKIVNTILTELAKRDGAKPSSVRVRVGERLHLVPSSVKMHFEGLARGTALQGVDLVLMETPVLIRCRGCGAQSGVEDHHLLKCRACGSLDTDLLSGDEIWIDSIEIRA